MRRRYCLAFQLAIRWGCRLNLLAVFICYPIRYGYNAIPYAWIEQLSLKEDIIRLAKRCKGQFRVNAHKGEIDRAEIGFNRL